jgi:membrane protein implicated in regulation of membrane protease activity
MEEQVMAWVDENFATLLIVLGFALLVVEVVFLGLGVLVLCFIGLACIVTGALHGLGILPDTLIAAFGSVAFFSVLFAALLWKPLKKIQNTGITKEVKGDFIGHSFMLEHPVSTTEFSRHRMSGVDWKVRSETPLPAGIMVEVVKADVGVLTVAASATAG